MREHRGTGGSQWVLEDRILLRNVEVCILILLVLLISVDLIFLISLPRPAGAALFP